MKKIIALLITLLFPILMLCGCTNNDQIFSYDIDKMETMARESARNMIEGNFDAVASTFDADLASKMTAEEYEKEWDKVVAPLGDYIEHLSAFADMSELYCTVIVTEKFENDNLLVTVTYNQQDELIGLWLSYDTVPSESGNFTEYEISFGVDENLQLEGYLTVPVKTPNPPVVLLVQGSGAANRDEAIGALRPFMDLAHSLAENGIASLRYDKRFFTHPNSGVKLGYDLTVKDEVLYDVEAAIDFLVEDERIDPEKIFVLGHSLGGMLSPAIAVENKEVKGIVSMAGSLRPLYEISYDQNIAMSEYLKENETNKKTLKKYEEMILQIEEDIKILRSDMTEVPNSQVLIGLFAGYQKSVKEYAGENFIDKVKVPILVLQGDADFQIKPETDFVLWEEALKDNENATLILYENLNHCMVLTNGKNDVTEYDVPADIPQEVIDDISEFIKNN